MKFLFILFVLCNLFFYTSVNPSFCEDESEKSEKKTSLSESQKPPVYVPPMRGAPNRRIGGGSRSLHVNKPFLTVIAPEHTGLTIQEQPTVYWYISEPAITSIEFTITTERGDDKFFEVKLPPIKVSGLQSFSLKEHDIRLVPNVEYKWYVSIVPDPKRRSKDIIAGGSIMRIPLDDRLKQRLEKTTAEDIFYVLAEEGIWYDTVESLTNLIKKYPNNEKYKEFRTKIFQQVGLVDID